MVCSREPIPFAWICMCFCIAGFQLVLQACLAIFIYTILTFDKKKKKKITSDIECLVERKGE
jgi:hypothetical protein